MGERRRYSAGMFFCLSALVVGFGQPLSFGERCIACSQFLCLITTLMGYALYWVAIDVFFVGEASSKKFWMATLWYGIVQGIQLSWLLSFEYHGLYILLPYVSSLFLLGAQFGVLSLCMPSLKNMEWRHVVLIPAVWIFLEWSRSLFLVGFMWNPMGLALTAFESSMRNASVFGVLGLSFWVLFTNMAALKMYSDWCKIFLCTPQVLPWTLQAKRGVWKPLATFVVCAALPYVYGSFSLLYHEQQMKETESQLLRVAVAQTAIGAEEKIPLEGRKGEFVHPLVQWKELFDLLSPLQDGSQEFSPDLLILPETTLPFRASSSLYPWSLVKEVLGERVALQPSPPSLFPKPCEDEARLFEGEQKVSNLFLAHALAKSINTPLLIGFDETVGTKNFNSVFYIDPKVHFGGDVSGEKIPLRYDKEILIPLAEYLPLSFLSPYVARYGLEEFFSPGGEGENGRAQGVLQMDPPCGVSVCYEECFSALQRKRKNGGARCLVYMSNDIWFPHSKLETQHFIHGRVHGVEVGLPIFRSCNGGISALVDSLGRSVSFDEANASPGRTSFRKGSFCDVDTWQGNRREYGHSGVLVGSLPLYVYWTPFALWGNGGILCIAGLLIIGSCRRRRRR